MSPTTDRRLSKLTECLAPLRAEGFEEVYGDKFDEICSFVNNGITEYRAVFRGKPPYRRAITEHPVGEGFHVIHNTDFGILKVVVNLATAVTASVLNPVAIIGPLIVLLYEVHKKTGWISERDGLVLLTLRKYKNGLTLRLLVEKLPLTKKWNEEEVLKSLEHLKRVSLKNGTTSAFVIEANGGWIAADV
jgi:hypothetical protein